MKRDYLESVHFYGRIWVALAICVLLMTPVAVCVAFNAWPEWTYVLKGLLGVAPIFWTVGIIEVLTFSPMLGTGGTYLGFVTGNLTNLKVPAALNAMSAAKVEPSSEEGEVISTIAIATSSIVTTLVIALGVLGLGFLQPFLQNQALQPAFDNIMAALIGALGVVYISKNWKLSIAPLVFMVTLFLLVPSLASSVGVLVPVGALVAILAGRAMYRKGWLDKKGAK